MKPQQQPSPDAEALQELGSASVEIVHDVKNQLNGLKLYATFLRKRFERAERPADEIETVNKILAGLERAATDMNALVRYSRPVELRRSPQTDLARLLADATGAASGGADESLHGDFDTAALAEALREIDTAARANASAEESRPVSLRRDDSGGRNAAVITWQGVRRTRDGRGLFDRIDGNAGLRLALAAKIIRAHGGAVEHTADAINVRLPLTQ
jgi:signal transduction histidine kinase